MNKILNILVFVVCASLPAYIVRFKILGIPTTLLEILILVLVIFWFFSKGLQIKNWYSFFGYNNFYPAIILLLVVSIISTFLSHDFNSAIGILKAYFIEPILLFLVISDRLNNSKRFAFYGLIAASIWLSFLAIIQKITGFGVPAYAQNEILQDRVVAVYNSGNSLALFLGPVFALTSDFFLRRVQFSSNFILKILIGFVVFLQVITIILSKSKGGIITSILVLYFILLGQFPKKDKLFKVSHLILFFVIFLNFLFPILAFFKLNFSDLPHDVTLKNRYFLWRGTVSLLFDRPLIGAGLNGFKELYGESYRLPDYDELLQYPHNLILTFWSELGIFGVFALLWIIFIFFKNSLKSKWLTLGFIGVVYYFLIHGIVDVPYFKNDLSAEFFVFLGILTQSRKT